MCVRVSLECAEPEAFIVVALFRTTESRVQLRQVQTQPKSSGKCNDLKDEAVDGWMQCHPFKVRNMQVLACKRASS